MSSAMNDLEKDIEESRARLDQTIDRIQDRLSVSSLVDEMLGTARRTPLSGAYDGALDAVRKNPVPVLLIAAGVGWLVHRMSKTAPRPSGALAGGRDRLPIVKNGAARVYDPDQPAGRTAGELAQETEI